MEWIEDDFDCISKYKWDHLVRTCDSFMQKFQDLNPHPELFSSDLMNMFQALKEIPDNCSNSIRVFFYSFCSYPPPPPRK